MGTNAVDSSYRDRLLLGRPTALSGVVSPMSLMSPPPPPPPIVPPAIQSQSSSFTAFLLEVWDRLTLPTSQPQRQDKSMTPEEVFGYLVCFSQHEEWLTTTMPYQPPPGSLFLFDRQKLTAYRKDGYVWKRKKGATVNTTRINRLTLKVFGKEIIHATYLKHDREPRFKRRDYWLNENRNIVLVHYLLERKYEILPTLSDSQWRELLDNSTRPEGTPAEDHNEVDVPSYLELLKTNPDAPSSSNGGQASDRLGLSSKDLPSLSAVPSQTGTLMQLDRKKKVVPIAPAPPSVQYSFSVIVLKGGLALIFAYPTSGVGQVVPLACVRLGENGEEGETPPHSLLQGGSLSATVARLLASNQIPSSAKQLLLQSLSAVAPQLSQQVEERPGPSEGPSTSQDTANASWSTALPPNMTSLLQSMAGVPAPLGSEAQATAPPTHPPARHLGNAARLQTVPTSSSGHPTSSASTELTSFSDLLKLTQSHAPSKTGSTQVTRSQSSPTPSSEVSSGTPYTSMDYDPQAFSQFARDLSSSVVDPLKPTLESKGKQKRGGRRFGYSHSCPVSPSPATSWASGTLSTVRPTGRLPTNGAGTLAALLAPLACYSGPSPLAHLGTLPGSGPTEPVAVASSTPASTPIREGANGSSSQRCSALPHQNGGTGPPTAPVDQLAFLEEMDWATLEQSLLSGTTATATSSSEHSSSRQEWSTLEESCVPPSSGSQTATDSAPTAMLTADSSGRHTHYPVPVIRSGEGPTSSRNHSNGHLQGGGVHAALTEANSSQPVKMHTSPAPSADMSPGTSCASMDYNQAFTHLPSGSEVDPLNPCFDSSLDSLLSTFLGDSGFMSSILEDTHAPPTRGEGQAHLDSELGIKPPHLTLASAPSQNETYLASSYSLALQHNRDHNMGSSPTHPVHSAHLTEAVTSPVDRMLHDILNMTSPKLDGPSAVGSSPSIGISPQQVSSGTSPMLPLMSSRPHIPDHPSHNPDSHSSSANSGSGNCHQQLEQMVVLSEGVSPNWTRRATHPANDMAAVCCTTEGSHHLSPNTHPTPVTTAPVHPPQMPVLLRTVPAAPHLAAHQHPVPGQPPLPSTPAPAQLPASGCHTMVTNSLQDLPSGLTVQATISAGSVLSGTHPATSALSGTRPATSDAQGPLVQASYLHPQPALPLHPQPTTWQAPSSHMDQSQSFLALSSPRLEPHSGTATSEAGRPQLQLGLPSTSPVKCSSPVDALKRELVWKLKALSCNDDTLQEELRHLEAHCTPCVHDALFEQAVIHVWRMVFSHLVERDGGSTASGSSAESTPDPSSEGVSLLHLVAALGFTACVEVLWRHSDSLAHLEEVSGELDPLSCDQDGCTPLFWACYRGNTSTAVRLLQWDPQPVVLPNNGQLLPLEAAAEQGHQHLVDTLYHFSSAVSATPSICISPAKDIQSQISNQVTMATSSEGSSPTPPPPSVSLSAGPSHFISPRYAVPPSPLYEQLAGEAGSSQQLVPLREIPQGQPEREGLPPEEGDRESGRSSLEVPMHTQCPWTLSPTLPRPGSQGGMLSTPAFSLFRPAPTSPMSPAESSSSSHSTSTLSVPGTPGIFDPTELCELLSESRSIEEHDFANMDLSDREQQELIKAARTIQTAFRKYTREQRMVRAQSEREKRAALTIESYYKRYRELKRQNQAALVIQQRYRLYRQSLAQHHREGVKRAAQVMEDFMRIRENEAAQKIQSFLRQWKRKKHRLCRDQSRS